MRLNTRFAVDRVRKLVLAMTLVCSLFVAIRTSQAQSFPLVDRTRFGTLDMWFGVMPDGRLQARARDGSWMQPFLIRDFLKSEAIRSELDLVGEQESRIAELLKKYDDRRQKLRDRWGMGEAYAGENGLRAELLELQEKIGDEVREVLLRPQWTRLQQLIMRIWYFRRLGFCTVVSRRLAQSLKLTDAQEGALVSAALPLANQLERRGMEERKAVIDELLSVLTEKQRARMRVELGDFYYGKSANVDLLVWQLGYDPKSKEARKTSDPYFGFDADWIFVLGCNGRLTPRRLPPSVKVSKVAFFHHLQFLRRSPDIESLLQLSDEQKVRLEEQLEEWKRESGKIVMRNTQYSKIADRQVRERLRAQSKKDVAELKQKIDKKVVKVLTIQQMATLAALARRMEAARRGHVAVLVDGTLGERIKISKTQQDRLLARAKQQEKQLVKKSLAWETEAYARLMQTLAPDQRTALQRLIGKPPQSMPGATSVLILDGFAETVTTVDSAIED